MQFLLFLVFAVSSLFLATALFNTFLRGTIVLAFFIPATGVGLKGFELIDLGNNSLFTFGNTPPPGIITFFKSLNQKI